MLRHIPGTQPLAQSAVLTRAAAYDGGTAGPRREADVRSGTVAVLDRILRAGEGRIVRKLVSIAEQVNLLEDDFVAMSDGELRAQTDEFKKRHADGEPLDDLLPEAFAAVREAARRTLGQRHFDVQLMGGAALHLGNI